MLAALVAERRRESLRPPIGTIVCFNDQAQAQRGRLPGTVYVDVGINGEWRTGRVVGNESNAFRVLYPGGVHRVPLGSTVDAARKAFRLANEAEAEAVRGPLMNVLNKGAPLLLLQPGKPDELAMVVRSDDVNNVTVRIVSGHLPKVRPLL